MILHSKSAVTVISSIAALEFLGAPLTYSSVKAALHPLVKSLSFSFGNNGARINLVAPGNILFPGSTWENKLNDKKDETLAYISREVPLKRFGKPEEVADLVAFLSSEKAAFITGSTIVIDGGQTKTYF